MYGNLCLLSLGSICKCVGVNFFPGKRSFIFMVGSLEGQILEFTA